MPLKLGPISQQMDGMVQRITDLRPEQEQFIALAQALLRSVDPDALRQKLDAQRSQRRRIPWLVATPRGSLCGSASAPPLPSDYRVIGTDASSMPPDRHSSVRYYVLNVGYAAIQYGSLPHATLDSRSQLCFRDEELYLFPERHDVPVEGTLLGARMEVEAVRILREVVPPVAMPTLALRDGPLILWTLQNESTAVQERLLDDLLETLSFLRQARVPVGGYISFSDSHDVTNALRVWLCQGQLNACDHCDEPQRELCLALAKIHDRELFGFLADGERSELFSSSSQVLQAYGEQQVDCMYFSVGGEIARIEVPRWVGSDAALLGLLHAGALDQCWRSSSFPPYPPALQEAHEQAAITPTERGLVEEMLARALARRGQRILHSAKDDSKRRRGV